MPVVVSQANQDIPEIALGIGVDSFKYILSLQSWQLVGDEQVHCGEVCTGPGCQTILSKLLLKSITNSSAWLLKEA